MRNPFKKAPVAEPEPLAILDLLKDGTGTRLAFLNHVEADYDDVNEPQGAASLQGDHAALGQSTAPANEVNGTTSIHGATPANGAIAPAPAFAKGTTHTVHDFDLYKIEIVKKRLSKDQARILRGDGTLFATFKGQRVLFEASGADINRRDIIYHKSTFGARRHFEVAGQEYVFEDSSKYRDKCLLFPTRKNNKGSAPLAVFELWPVSRTHRGQIRLYEAASDMDTMIEMDEDGQVHPTRLLDVAIVAYFCLLSFKWNESLVQSLQDPKGAGSR